MQNSEFQSIDVQFELGIRQNPQMHQSCRALRNTDSDLKLPLKKLIGKKDILSEEENRGIVSQLVPNKHHLWQLSSLIYK